MARALIVLVLVLVGCSPGPSKDLVGTFVRWEPVDTANGYAWFTVTNTGSRTETAKCTISVRNDFGDFGFDSLVGETVAPGQTITRKMAISVGKGSLLINSGTVKDC